MSLEMSSHPVFAGHQTFHPRFGWLKKGFDAASTDPHVFGSPDAPLRLGVGKNMVEAIRFWTNATHITVRLQDPANKRQSIVVPTNLGDALLGHRGLDPYFEDPATLWVLHWQAVSSGSWLPVWWSVFNDLTAMEFSEEDLLRFSEDQVAATTWSDPKPQTLKKDVDCLIRMYSRGNRRARQTMDELLDSPFRELGLLMPSPGDQGLHRFNRGAKASLPTAVVAYACLDYVARAEAGSETMSVSRMAADPGSPGRLFKVSEEVVLAALERHTGSQTYELASPGGAPQMVLRGEPALVAGQLLREHYGEGSPGRSTSPNLAGSGARLPKDPAFARPLVAEGIQEALPTKGTAA